MLQLRIESFQFFLQYSIKNCQFRSLGQIPDGPINFKTKELKMINLNIQVQPSQEWQVSFLKSRLESKKFTLVKKNKIIWSLHQNLDSPRTLESAFNIFMSLIKQKILGYFKLDFLPQGLDGNCHLVVTSVEKNSLWETFVSISVSELW